MNVIIFISEWNLLLVKIWLFDILSLIPMLINNLILSIININNNFNVLNLSVLFNFILVNIKKIIFIVKIKRNKINITLLYYLLNVSLNSNIN